METIPRIIDKIDAFEKHLSKLLFIIYYLL